jgi:Spy/CpxP family protein refolding chaperone
MKRLKLAVVLAGLALFPLRVAAQPRSDAPWRDRARTFLVLRIADALKLDEQEALKVSAVIRQSDEHRQALAQERRALEQKLREALGKQPPDTAALTKLISEGNDIDQKLAMVPEQSFHELQKTLTVEQQAKLMLFRRELQAEIRRALQGRRAGAGRPGRGAAPGGPPATD